MQIDISKLTDDQLCKLINNRWESSSSVWDIIDKVYKQNTAIYENRADWLHNIPYKRQSWRVQANRIFTDMEAVINSLIANPPGINVLPARKNPASQDFASKLENYFRNKYIDLNIKETMRMAYRNLYFSRLLVVKPFWNISTNDFDFKAIDPRKIRVGKYARKEQDTEFAIEEIEDNLCAVVDRFPEKKEELMKKFGITEENDLYIKNPDAKYKEAWINDYVIFKLDTIILDKIKNPYWDWDGIMITAEEEAKLNGSNDKEPLQGDARRQLLQQIKLAQGQRQPQTQIEGQNMPLESGMTQETMQSTLEGLKPYYFNYFDNPRKPYIFATIFNNKNTPIGRTDMITLASELQRTIDKRKMDIDENCEMVNGILKVDASVMGKSDAQRIRFETKGIIWGKGVKDGVTREFGNGLPNMVFEDMQDSRSEIDNIMAASSAFRGEREGQETKAGRLALVQQSYLRLSELVQVGDFVYKEIFDWGMQLAKTRYTEYHYAKWMGKEDANDIIEIIQDDFETGTEVKIIAGKTLPVDDEFRFEQAQADYDKGLLSPVDYLRICKYDNPNEIAKNAFMYKASPVSQLDLTPEEQQQIPQPQVEPTPVSISFKDLPIDGKVQAAAKLDIQLDPNIMIAENLAENNNKRASLKQKTKINEKV